ncbi:MAG TPA: hypothetical protein VHT73_12385, partial [Thermodesulfobacteriota bacterium]|nr:hypothetical protein [Thermodesulfobacteriota bacterium]
SEAALEMKLNLSTESNKFLLLLLSTDIIFISLHVIFTHTPYVGNPYFLITEDRGYAEAFQYIKEYWLMILFLILAVQKRSLLYFGWSLFFGFLLMDDSFQIHERAGTKIRRNFDFSPMFGLRTQDLGELIVFAIVGTFFLVYIGFAYYFSQNDLKEICRRLLVLLIALVLFAVVIDAVHTMARSLSENAILNTVFQIVEDGGEMVVMSIIAWFVLSLTGRERRLRNS